MSGKCSASELTSSLDFYLFTFYFILRQGLAVWSWLALNSQLSQTSVQLRLQVFVTRYTLKVAVVSSVFVGSFLPPSSSLFPFAAKLASAGSSAASASQALAPQLLWVTFRFTSTMAGHHSVFVVLSLLWPILYLLLLWNVNQFLSLRSGMAQLRNWCACHWQTLQTRSDWFVICDLGTEILENLLYPRQWDLKCAAEDCRFTNLRALLCYSTVWDKGSLHQKWGCLPPFSSSPQAKP